MGLSFSIALYLSIRAPPSDHLTWNRRSSTTFFFSQVLYLSQVSSKHKVRELLRVSHSCDLRSCISNAAPPSAENTDLKNSGFFSKSWG